MLTLMLMVPLESPQGVFSLDQVGPRRLSVILLFFWYMFSQGGKLHSSSYSIAGIWSFPHQVVCTANYTKLYANFFIRKLYQIIRYVSDGEWCCVIVWLYWFKLGKWSQVWRRLNHCSLKRTRGRARHKEEDQSPAQKSKIREVGKKKCSENSWCLLPCMFLLTKTWLPCRSSV